MSPLHSARPRKFEHPIRGMVIDAARMATGHPKEWVEDCLRRWENHWGAPEPESAEARLQEYFAAVHERLFRGEERKLPGANPFDPRD